MRRHQRTRIRREGRWRVAARIERFHEPAVLLLLAERPRHGYELQEELPALVPGERTIDFGNLYRLLRGLEAEGLVESAWHAELPGPAKRVYELAGEGHAVLAAWADGLRGLQTSVDAFLERYESHERR